MQPALDNVPRVTLIPILMLAVLSHKKVDVPLFSSSNVHKLIYETKTKEKAEESLNSCNLLCAVFYLRTDHN